MTTADGYPRLAPDFESLLASPSFPDLRVDTIAHYRVAMPSLGSTDLVERSDLTIDGDHQTVRIRLHRPRGSQNGNPVVVSLHGGGYIMGDYNMDDEVFERWCPALGVAGVSVDYRLSPESPFPAALEDASDAFQWIHANAQEFGFDAERVGVFGSSAGGGLAAALAQRVRDVTQTPLAFQLLESPMLDDRQQTVSSQIDDLVIWPREANELGWRCYLGDLYGRSDMPPYAAASRAGDLSDLPPTFISVGGADGFRDEAVDYALRLSQAGVLTDLRVYAGAPHGYQLFTDSAVARRSNQDSFDWLSAVLKQRPELS